MRNPVSRFTVGLVSALLALITWCPISAGDEAASGQGEWIGVSVKPLSSAWRERWGYWRPGMLVTEVTPGGPADQAGIGPGDLLVIVGSVSLTDEADLAVAKSRNEPGQPISVVVARNNGSMLKIMNLTPVQPPPPAPEGVVPGADDGAAVPPPTEAVTPSPQAPAPPDVAHDRWATFGAQVAALNADLASALSVPVTHGVIVLDVMSGGSADRVGIRAGDVITSAGGQSIEGVGDLRRAVEGAASTFALHVQRGGAARDVEASLESPPAPGDQVESTPADQKEQEAMRDQLQALRREVEKLRAQVEALQGQ